ncbi:MAG: type II toxin-antitoxin system VapC family toxin [Verrucomicrobiales bacterium]|nr:type II toxin-antitoxin system VapC family toxin [Verrucomicrobiales bacterium]
MITSVDSSVLLDILLNDPRFGARSLAALVQCQNEGKVIICEAVIAEISPALSLQREVEEFLDDSGVEFIAISRGASIEAGQMFSCYLKSGGKRGRVAADFLIGAHAKIQAERLLTRDAGFYRNHFNGLKVISP